MNISLLCLGIVALTAQYISASIDESDLLALEELQALESNFEPNDEPIDERVLKTFEKHCAKEIVATEVCKELKSINESANGGSNFVKIARSTCTQNENYRVDRRLFALSNGLRKDCSEYRTKFEHVGQLKAKTIIDRVKRGGFFSALMNWWDGY